MTRFTLLLLTCLAVGATGSTATAATLPGCANPVDSALNQYCDSYPSAAGPQTPRPGAPLSPKAALPPGAAVVTSPVPGRAGTSSHVTRVTRVTVLPAAVPDRAPAAAVTRAATTSLTWLWIVLAAVLGATGAVAFGGRRKRDASR